MREIKFRAWDYKTKMMYTQNVSIHTFRFEKDVPWELVGLRGLICDHTDGTLMQFTGLLDKNGKEIYEGDIIKFRNAVSETFKIGRVEFITPTFIIKPIYGGCFDFMACHKEEPWEVIGNIYENPELLKT